MLFRGLDFVCIPSGDVDNSFQHFAETMRAEPLSVRALLMGLNREGFQIRTRKSFILERLGSKVSDCAEQMLHVGVSVRLDETMFLCCLNILIYGAGLL
jgi:hypothetical protein